MKRASWVPVIGGIYVSEWMRETICCTLDEAGTVGCGVNGVKSSVLLGFFVSCGTLLC